MKKILLTLALLSAATFAHARPKELLNVSYDPTRELYAEYNPLFAKHWKEKTGEEITVKQSHGGSGKQARAVIDGLKADVVTLALAYDVDAIAEKSKALPLEWQKSFPNNSAPYTSTIVFLVKKGNPKHIKDWEDLTRSDVKVITPNPKTSGGARWNYLATYAYALKKFEKDESKSEEFLSKVFANVPVFDTGARGSTITFVQRGIGDVLITWENEAFLALKEQEKNKFEIVVPSLSIRTEPPVAVVDSVASKNGTLDAAREYLNYLYSKEAQALIAKHYYRPIDPEVVSANATRFPAIELVSINDFGGWKEVQKKHFDDGGVFDRVLKNK